jgi:alkylation response protein AidB-like acyl-CoA dehydrogenase
VDEREAVRGLAREFVHDAFPSAAVRAAIEAGTYPRPAWLTLSNSLGLAGIGIPERYGGAGATFAELGVVVEEFGAGLAPVPLISTASAAAAVLAGADEAGRAAVLPEIAAGTTIAVPILRGDLRAEPGPRGWLVDGTATPVPDASAAGLFVVAARTDAGRALVAVRSPGAGLSITPLNSLDGTRPAGTVRFSAAPAVDLGAGPEQWPGLVLARDAHLAALACEQVGGAARCLDLIVEYAKTRVQFGVPIGSFQAIKHRCADLAVELEAARSIAYDARDRVAAGLTGPVGPAGDDGGAVHASVAAAAAWCGPAYVHAAQEAIQLHGGIGFTWEHDAHLHLRRARADELQYGSPREHRRELIAALGW